MAEIYARLSNQNIFKYKTIFSARFDKRNEEGQTLDLTESYISLIISHNKTESDLLINIVRFASQEKLERQRIKDCGWTFD